MDKNLVFDLAKNEVIQVISKTKLEEFILSKEHILTLVNLMENVCKLSLIEVNISESLNGIDGDNEKCEKGGHQVKTEMIQDDNLVEDISSNIESDAYVFQRKLRGGFISEIPTFVPETVVRNLGLGDGDLVAAEEVGPGRYDFLLIERNSKKTPSLREEINYGLVERDGQILVVRNYIEEGEPKTIRINEVPFSFLIREEDIQEFEIKEGDILDIAFNSNKPEYAKVVWKHNNNQQMYRKPLPSSNYKLKIKTEKKNILEDFKGQNILIIGCEPRKAIYKEEVEKRNGVFLWASGTEEQVRLKGLIKKADFVIMLTSFIRHKASYSTVDLCKELNTKFSALSTLGIESIVSEISKHINGEVIKSIF